MSKAYNIVHRISCAKSIWYDTLIVGVVLAACSLIGLVFYLLGLSEANIITIYVLGILLISSVASDKMYGIIASVIGVLLFNCLYAEPRFTLFVYDPQYSITTIIMLIASIITSSVMALLRLKLNSEMLETRRLDILLETSQNMQQAQNMEDILNVAVSQLHRMFERTIILFPTSEGKLSDPMVKSADGAFDPLPAEWKLEENVIEKFLHSEADAELNAPLILIRGKNKVIFYRIQVNNTAFAIAGIIFEADKNITAFERNLILAILDETVISLEKHHLHVFNERIAREAEAERLRASLLRTISHDLRTPLTSISGNAYILLSKGGQIEAETHNQLCQSIYDDSEWLIGMVENLLFVTRIENGGMAIHTEAEVLQEIIPEALKDNAKRVKAHNISLEMSEEFIVVRIDSRLFMQVIINIIDNAVKYTPAGADIRIRVFRRGTQAVVEVADTGYGIGDEDKQKVFEMFYTADNKSGDGRRGIGLGLPLCRSIMHAHGGTIHIEDNIPSGSVVILALDAEEVCL